MNKKAIEEMIDTINRALGECSNKEKSVDYKLGCCHTTLEIVKSDLQTQLKYTKEE